MNAVASMKNVSWKQNVKAESRSAAVTKLPSFSKSIYSILRHSQGSWLKCPPAFPNFPEESGLTISQITTKVNGSGSLSLQFSRYSLWYKLQTTVAWLLHLKRLLYHKDILTGTLTVDGLEAAQLEIVEVIQRDTFSHKILLLQSTTGREKRFPGSLRKLNPLLHDGVAQVGGRLNMSSMAFSQKHPIILPSDHHVTQLIIEDDHRKVGHCVMVSTWTSLRQSFWIVKGAATVRKVLGKCIIYQRWNSHPGSQIMSDLPVEPLTPDKPPFQYTRVNFYGPFAVYQCPSCVKRYGCIFTCMTSRAVRLEVAHVSTVDWFLNAFRRFLSRQGKVHTSFSDNGTDFVGTETELQRTLCECNTNFLAEQIRQHGIWWQFNPPLESHMGGVWERSIRSAKKIFNALLLQQRVTSECLSTLMMEVEYKLNSWPLIPILLNPEAQEPLAPNHFAAVWSQRCVITPGLYLKSDCYSRNRWKQIQYLVLNPGIYTDTSTLTKVPKWGREPPCGRYRAVVRGTGSLY